MSDDDIAAEAKRYAAASRLDQGLPPTVTDEATLNRLSAIVADTPETDDADVA